MTSVAGTEPPRKTFILHPPVGTENAGYSRPADRLGISSDPLRCAMAPESDFDWRWPPTALEELRCCEVDGHLDWQRELDPCTRSSALSPWVTGCSRTRTVWRSASAGAERWCFIDAHRGPRAAFKMSRLDQAFEIASPLSTDFSEATRNLMAIRFVSSSSPPSLIAALLARANCRVTKERSNKNCESERLLRHPRNRHFRRAFCDQSFTSVTQQPVWLRATFVFTRGWNL